MSSKIERIEYKWNFSAIPVSDNSDAPHKIPDFSVICPFPVSKLSSRTLIEDIKTVVFENVESEIEVNINVHFHLAPPTGILMQRSRPSISVLNALGKVENVVCRHERKLKPVVLGKCELEN